MKIVATNTDTNVKVKLPDFGILVRENGQFVRIGHSQFKELHKLPIQNSIPTKLCVYGFVLEPNELELVVDAFNKSNFEPDEIIAQIQHLNKLVSLTFPTRRSTIKSYPFCKIELLTPTQLEHMNNLYNLNIKHEAYRIFMETILTPEVLKPAFLEEGVLNPPEISFNKSSTSSMDDNINDILTSLLNKKTNNSNE